MRNGGGGRPGLPSGRGSSARRPRDDLERGRALALRVSLAARIELPALLVVQHAAHLHDGSQLDLARLGVERSDGIRLRGDVL